MQRVPKLLLVELYYPSELLLDLVLLELVHDGDSFGHKREVALFLVPSVLKLFLDVEARCG